MKFFNLIDEQGRFCGLKVSDELAGQEDSHTYSYMKLRNMYKELGDTMGLEKIQICSECKSVEYKPGKWFPKIPTREGIYELFTHGKTIETICPDCENNKNNFNRDQISKILKMLNIPEKQR